MGLHRPQVLAETMWAPTAATPFLAEHLKSRQDYPPRQGADTLSMKKAIDDTMKKMSILTLAATR